MPQPDPAPKTLDDLMARAEHYANYCMRGTSHVTPAAFIIGPDGLLMFAPENPDSLLESRPHPGDG